VTHLRTATPADVRRLQQLEEAADSVFADVFGTVPWSSTPGEWRAREPGVVLVAAEEPAGEAIGFAHVHEVEGLAHLEQLAVHPDRKRRGHGRALVEAAKTTAGERGHDRLSLSTYAEIPWHAPFYATCGFVETEPTAPYHRRIRQVEQDLGLGRYGRRVLMVAEVSSGSGPSSR
jgi:GNAT superfamily N-acetyltransferase